MIELRDVRYRYPGSSTWALDGVSLRVRDGEMVVIAGDSGGGKSTLARAITGLVPHFHGGEFAGTVLTGGRDTRTHAPRDLADVVGFVAQDPESQAVVDRVEDEIVFAMENLGVAPILMRKRMEEVLDALAISHLRDRRLETLSGGERQRVAIAGVLAAQPKCLVLDEPTSQLDPQSAEDVLGVLHRLNADLGLTIVLVEHRLERVVQYADRMIVLHDGRIACDGTPRDVLGRNGVATPLSRIGRALGWEPLPLTVREGRAFASALRDQLAPVQTPAPSFGESLVEVEGMRVALGAREVVRGIDLRVSAGETVAIVGRNGSGKTTLLRALVGLLRPHAGRRTVAGLDPANVPVERLAARVAYVPQAADALLFHENVRDEIRFTLAARAPHEDVDVLLASAGLADFATADPRDLSAGQRLRVALLAATAGDPRVVLLDEPTRGMDAAGKDRLAHDLAAWRAAGRATLLVTHDVELVARVATRVVLLSAGSIVLDGPVRDVLGESTLFGSQMNKVFSDARILTVEDALAAVSAG
ncbi:MAG: ATP-binding cassette domain-containing protein [Actinomycetota bacterium]